MFNWLGNLFPYSDLHSLNLDWILTKMKETAAQAAKAVADAANALAQVAEAKAAALSAQTAAQNAQTAANNAQTAANNAADSAENAIAEAQAAKSAAQTAQNTANTAQTAAQNAESAVATLNNKFPIKTVDIADSAVTTAKIANNSINNSKIISGSLYLTAFAKTDLYTNLDTVSAGSAHVKTYSGTPLEFTYGSAEEDRAVLAVFRLIIDGESLAVSIPGDSIAGVSLIYRHRLVRSNGQDLIISVTVSGYTLTFNIDNYAESGLSSFKVYLHKLKVSTSW